MPNREHEEKIIAALLNELSKRGNFTLKDIEYPEKLKPLPANPIDAIYYTDKNTYVIEHTTLETYNKQITEDNKVIKLIEGLKNTVESKLNIKGKFVLVLPPGAFYDIKIIKKINELENWILQTAPTLKEGKPKTAPNHYKCKIIENIDFKICLYRWPCLTTEFYVERYAPNDIKKCIDDMVENRLHAKMKKLNEWKISKNAISILVLESFDFALADNQSICNSIKKSIINIVDKPDIVFILQTYKNSTNIYLLKIEENFQYRESNFYGFLEYE